MSPGKLMGIWVTKIANSSTQTLWRQMKVRNLIALVLVEVPSQEKGILKNQIRLKIFQSTRDQVKEKGIKQNTKLTNSYSQLGLPLNYLLE